MTHDYFRERPATEPSNPLGPGNGIYPKLIHREVWLCGPQRLHHLLDRVPRRPASAWREGQPKGSWRNSRGLTKKAQATMTTIVVYLTFQKKWCRVLRGILLCLWQLETHSYRHLARLGHLSPRTLFRTRKPAAFFWISSWPLAQSRTLQQLRRWIQASHKQWKSVWEILYQIWCILV